MYVVFSMQSLNLSSIEFTPIPINPNQVTDLNPTLIKPNQVVDATLTLITTVLDHGPINRHINKVEKVEKDSLGQRLISKRKIKNEQPSLWKTDFRILSLQYCIEFSSSQELSMQVLLYAKPSAYDTTTKEYSLLFGTLAGRQIVYRQGSRGGN